MSDESKLWRLIEENPTGMMVTVEPDGGLRGRPMRAIADRDGRALWFYTRLASGKSAELERDGHVCLCFADPRVSEFVSVSGHAALSADRERIRRHWSRFVDAWFPEGPDGEDVGMIRMEIEKGEYWDGESSGVVAALKMLVASERDEIPDLGDNRRVAF